MRLTDLVTPLKPLEAMAQRRLVAASDVGGHRELIRHGDTGTLFPPNDPPAMARALAALLADRDSWEGRRARGRAFVEQERNWAVNVARYAPVYQKLTDGVASDEAWSFPPRPQHLILPVAPLAAAIIGLCTAGMFALVPTELLESLVVDSGIAAVLSAAEPPLGLTARLALALVCGGGVALVAWFGLFLLFGTRTVVVQRTGRGGGDAPVLRRADSHPDAPARRPLFANTDLGTPFLEVRARAKHADADVIESVPVVEVKAIAPPPPERPLPVDLDQPLAAFDPAAVPEEPIDWFPPPAQLLPRRQTFDPGERFETFPLTPPAPVAAPVSSPEAVRRDPSETIHALLDRLERVAARRETSGPAGAPGNDRGHAYHPAQDGDRRAVIQSSTVNASTVAVARPSAREIVITAISASKCPA